MRPLNTLPFRTLFKRLQFGLSYVLIHYKSAVWGAHSPSVLGGWERSSAVRKAWPLGLPAGRRWSWWTPRPTVFPPHGLLPLRIPSRSRANTRGSMHVWVIKVDSGGLNL